MAYLIPYRLIYFNLVKNSFAIKVVETWNRLTDRVKLTQKPKSFKKELKNIMSQKERMEKRKEARKIIPCMLYRMQIRIPTQVESQPRDIQHSHR